MFSLPKPEQGCLHALRGFMRSLCLCPPEQCGQHCHKVLQLVELHSRGGIWGLGA